MEKCLQRAWKAGNPSQSWNPYGRRSRRVRSVRNWFRRIELEDKYESYQEARREAKRQSKERAAKARESAKQTKEGFLSKVRRFLSRVLSKQ